MQQTGAHKGYAFVHYESTPAGKSGALKAVERMSNVFMDGIFLFAELSQNFHKSENIVQVIFVVCISTLIIVLQ